MLRDLEVSDIDAFHTCAAGRFDPGLPILVNTTHFWRDVESIGSFEKNVGIGLMPFGVLGRDDGVEPIVDIHVLQLANDNSTYASTGDGHRQLAPMLPRNFDDRIDRF